MKGNRNGMVFDAHVWCEHDGEIIDYDDEALIGNTMFPCPRGEIVRRPFKEDLQEKLMPIFMRILNAKVRGLRKLPLAERKEYMRMVNTVGGSCLMRAVKYKQKNPNAVLVIGSLGFVGHNGEVRYEFG